jgi:hypothetical protein
MCMYHPKSAVRPAERPFFPVAFRSLALEVNLSGSRGATRSKKDDQAGGGRRDVAL